MAEGGKLCESHAASGSLADVVACGQCAVALLRWFGKNTAGFDMLLDDAIEDLEDPSRPFPEERE